MQKKKFFRSSEYLATAAESTSPSGFILQVE